MKHLIFCFLLISCVCNAATESYYGKWVGISRSTEAIYGNIILEKSKISWGGNLGKSLCNAKYKVIYSGKASEHNWPKFEDLNSMINFEVLKIQIDNGSISCSKAYPSLPVIQQLRYISFWVSENNFDAATLIEFNESNEFSGEGTISKY